MDRFRGELTARLNGAGGTLFKVAVSLCLSPSGNALAAPTTNALFFTGDRVQGTGNKIIEELSDSTNIARLLVPKLGGGGVNAWVVSAAAFNGPFAVYKEFVPSVDSVGDPRGYDPTGLPASKSIVSLLSSCIRQVRAIVGDQRHESVELHSIPSTVLIGFSKGGIILNQIFSEISCIEAESPNAGELGFMDEVIFPHSEVGFLQSIAAFHFVDVGLNCPGAYLTDSATIKRIVEHFHKWDKSKLVKVVLHGTPRQWCDSRRPWICEEKDRLAQLLSEEEACGGRVSFKEVMYFPNIPPSLQMHFEIIKSLQLV